MLITIAIAGRRRRKMTPSRGFVRRSVNGNHRQCIGTHGRIGIQQVQVAIPKVQFPVVEIDRHEGMILSRVFSPSSPMVHHPLLVVSMKEIVLGFLHSGPSFGAASAPAGGTTARRCSRSRSFAAEAFVAVEAAVSSDDGQRSRARRLLEIDSGHSTGLSSRHGGVFFHRGRGTRAVVVVVVDAVVDAFGIAGGITVSTVVAPDLAVVVVVGVRNRSVLGLLMRRHDGPAVLVLVLVLVHGRVPPAVPAPAADTSVEADGRTSRRRSQKGSGGTAFAAAHDGRRRLTRGRHLPQYSRRARDGRPAVLGSHFR
mmetsp:Transcript_12996/g.26435  ORF Transcript_12996/g.26435 Transcript_12996/m.26435 type:complete len:312 (+) Transcript_12996:1716-2651(+)